MISPQNILRHELIGLDVLVIRASNPTHVGISGRIIDETRNTLLIAGEGMPKRIPKQNSRLRVTLAGGVRVEIDGSVLVMAPEKRISLQVKN